MGKALFLVAIAAFAGRTAAAEPVIHPRFNDLMTAVIYEDPETVQELLGIGKWPDKPDSLGYTPLAVAIELGQRPSAEMLLAAGADPDKRAQDGRTPRLIAREKGEPGLLALLERYGAAAGATSPPP